MNDKINSPNPWETRTYERGFFKKHQLFLKKVKKHLFLGKKVLNPVFFVVKFI